jgi:nucleolar protein 12
VLLKMGIFDGVKIESSNPLFSSESQFFETRERAPLPPVGGGGGGGGGAAAAGVFGGDARKKKSKKSDDDDAKNEDGGKKKEQKKRLVAAMKHARDVSRKKEREEEDDDDAEAKEKKRRRNKSVLAETKEETMEGEYSSDEEEYEGFVKGGKKKSARSLTSENASTSSKKSEEEMKEELKRTIFVGNVPTKTKPKELVAFFKELMGAKAKHAEVVSARIRSVPLKKNADEKDAKVPIRAKILGSMGKKKNKENNGAINEASKSGCTAYIVWKREKDCERAVKKGNMQKFKGHTLRVDFAAKSSQKKGGGAGTGDDGSGVNYDRTKSVFVGNLPFDVSDEEVIEIFTKNKEYKELKTELEAVRVVRDKTTRTGKGIAFILFKSVKAARTALLLDGFEMGKRELRVTKVGVVAPKRGNEVTKSRERVGKGNANSKSGSGSENNANKRKASSWEGGRSAKGNKVAKFEKKSSVTGDGKRGGANAGSSRGKKGAPAKTTTTKKKSKEPRASGKKRPAVALRKAKMKAGL